MSYKINNALFWAYFPITVFSFLLPFYCVSLGFTPLQTTSLSAVFSLVLFFGKIISGKLCDSLGRKKIFLTGLVLCAAAYVILAFSKNVVSLYSAQVFRGVAVSLLSVSSYTMICDNPARNVAASMGSLSGAIDRGGLWGALAYALLMYNFTFEKSWQYFFLISAALAVYALFAFGRTLESSSVAAASPSKKELLNRPILKELIAVNVLLSLSTTVVGSVIVLFLFERFTFSNNNVTIVLFIPAIIFALLKPKIGRFSGKIGENPSFFIGLAGTIVCVAAMVLSPTPVALAVALIGYQSAGLLSSLALDSMFARCTSDNDRGILSGVYSSSLNIGNAAGSLIGGATFGYFGAASPFYFSIGFCVVTVGVFYVLVSRRFFGKAANTRNC